MGRKEDGGDRLLMAALEYTTPPDDRDQWHKLVSGLLSDGGVSPDVAELWSSKGARYKPGEVVNGRGWRTRIGVGSFIRWAREQPGFSEWYAGAYAGRQAYRGIARRVNPAPAPAPAPAPERRPLMALYREGVTMAQVCRAAVWFVSIKKRWGLERWDPAAGEKMVWRHTINDAYADDAGGDGVLLARRGGHYRQGGAGARLRVERHRSMAAIQGLAERSGQPGARASLSFAGSGSVPFPFPLAVLDCDYQPPSEDDDPDGSRRAAGMAGRDAALRACLDAGMACYASSSYRETGELRGFHALSSLSAGSLWQIWRKGSWADEWHGIDTGLPGLSWDLFLPGCLFHTAVNLDLHIGGPGVEDVLPELTPEHLLGIAGAVSGGGAVAGESPAVAGESPAGGGESSADDAANSGAVDSSADATNSDAGDKNPGVPNSEDCAGCGVAPGVEELGGLCAGCNPQPYIPPAPALMGVCLLCAPPGSDFTQRLPGGLCYCAACKPPDGGYCPACSERRRGAELGQPKFDRMGS